MPVLPLCTSGVLAYPFISFPWDKSFGFRTSENVESRAGYAEDNDLLASTGTGAASGALPFMRCSLSVLQLPSNCCCWRMLRVTALPLSLATKASSNARGDCPFANARKSFVL